MPGILSFDTTVNDSFKTITHGIQATTLVLRSYKVITEGAPVADPPVASDQLNVLKIPKFLNIEFGNIIGTNYVVDDDPAARFFTLPLSPDYIAPNLAGDKLIQITRRDCYLPLVMSGDLPNKFDFRVRDEDLALVGPWFKYLLLQFEIM